MYNLGPDARAFALFGIASGCFYMFRLLRGSLWLPLVIAEVCIARYLRHMANRRPLMTSSVIVKLLQCEIFKLFKALFYYFLFLSGAIQLDGNFYFSSAQRNSLSE